MIILLQQFSSMNMTKAEQGKEQICNGVLNFKENLMLQYEKMLLKE